ncbi:MAG: F0F1 ATP synthase subunit gamma [Haliea sp.]|uniref:F0F1 ATP synthase subunit gamma n=1 Tax=Haliea sp. TaxID=1932666 RepID=UPI0032ED1986
MTERLEDVRRHLAAIDDIGEVVGALRAIAAAHSADARFGLEAISDYEAKVSEAFVRLAAPVAEAAVDGPGLVIVVGAAQGFSGGYPARIAEAAQQLSPPGAGLLVIGQRTLDILAVAGINPLWSADLPATASIVPALASEVTDALLEFGYRYPGPIVAISGSDGPGLPIDRRRLWPPERTETSAQPTFPTAPPLTTLPITTLLRGLLSEMLFAEVARTLMRGLRIENRARIEAMARAQANLKTRRTNVAQRYRQARQEQMTTEVIELSMGQRSR